MYVQEGTRNQQVKMRGEEQKMEFAVLLRSGDEKRKCDGVVLQDADWNKRTCAKKADFSLCAYVEK